MIPRTLVPLNARLPAAADIVTQRRRPTTLDERTLVPAMLPVVQLDGRSTIPTNLPLDSIAARVVVPRDINREAYSVQEDYSAPLQPTDMDERVTVPQGAIAPDITATLTPSENLPTDLIEPDVFLTGEVNLLAAEQASKKTASDLVVRISSVAFHILLLVLTLALPKIFPPRPPTQAEQEIARRQMTFLLPPGAFDLPSPQPKPKLPKSETLRVDPRMIRKVAPEVPKPLPGPVEPERVVKNLPSAPVAKPSVGQPTPQPDSPAPKVVEAPKPPVKLEAPDAQPTTHGLLLPKVSPGRAIQESAREAAKNSAPRAIAEGGQLPNSGVPGGGGHASAFGSIQMLTPDEGVDFSNYLTRVLTSVQRNWYAVMPESAQLGDKGAVLLRFKIMRNGSVPRSDPERVRGSGKEPLDRAAVSGIRSSNPFEPLPSAFSGPYIEVQIMFLYNLPLDYRPQ